jgi:hypothetical protein
MNDGARGGTHAVRRSSVGACALVLFAVTAARAQQSGPAAPVQAFARVQSPTAIFVDPAGDVTVWSEPPIGEGRSETRFSPEGEPVNTGAIPELDGRGNLRNAWVDTGTWRGTADVSASGLVELVPAHDTPAETPYQAFDLRAFDGETVGAVDVDAPSGSELVDVTLSSVRYLDIAALATGPDEITVFLTGLNGAGAAEGGATGEIRPLIVKGVVSPSGATEPQWWLVATSQAANVDPEHRSGVAVATIPAELTGDRVEGIVWATIPTATTAQPAEGAPEGGDAVVLFRSTYPAAESGDPGDAPTILIGGSGAPLRITTSAMASDSAGNVYLLVTLGECATEAAPGVLAVRSDFATEAVRDTFCHPVPATADGTIPADYWDLAVRNPGDPIYLTDNAGGVVYEVTSTVPPPLEGGPILD